MNAEQYFEFNRSKVISKKKKPPVLNGRLHNEIGYITFDNHGTVGFVDNEPKRLKTPIECLELP